MTTHGITIPEGGEAHVRLRFGGEVGARAPVDGGEVTSANEDVARVELGDDSDHVVIKAAAVGQTQIKYRYEHAEDDSGERDLECLLNVTVAAHDDEATRPTSVDFDPRQMMIRAPRSARRRGKTPRQRRREEAEKHEAQSQTANQGGGDAPEQANPGNQGGGGGTGGDQQEEQKEGGEAKMPGALDHGGKKLDGTAEDQSVERGAGVPGSDGKQPRDPKGELEASEVATAGAGAPRGGQPLPSGEPVPSAERIRNPAAPETLNPGVQPRPGLRK